MYQDTENHGDEFMIKEAEKASKVPVSVLEGCVIDLAEVFVE